MLPAGATGFDSLLNVPVHGRRGLEKGGLFLTTSAWLRESGKAERGLPIRRLPNHESIEHIVIAESLALLEVS